MKREIKFRAWDIQEKKMISNGCIGAGSSCQMIVIEWNGGLSLCNAYGLPDGSNPTFDKPVTERFELMQFTGLKDKNEKEIYEGDILKTGTDKPMVVGWSKKFASFVLNRNGWAFSHWFGESCNPEDCEIIGNKYQNAELLQSAV